MTVSPVFEKILKIYRHGLLLALIEDFKKIINERSWTTRLLTLFSVILSAAVIIILEVSDVISVHDAGILAFILPASLYITGVLLLILNKWSREEDSTIESEQKQARAYLKEQL